VKYSIILPYYKRPELWHTLKSFANKYFERRDYEVIIVEDSKNANDSDHHFQMMDIIKCFEDRMIIKHYSDDKVSYNPSHKYNLGFQKATGDYIVLSSPEVWHESDVLGGFDETLAEHPDSYVVCACMARRGDEFYQWYQHSKERNVMFHFCSVMSRQNFDKIGGFDERYCDGIGFDDEALLHRISSEGIPIITRDNLMVIHQEHERDYMDSHRDLVEVNRNLFLESVTK